MRSSTTSTAAGRQGGPHIPLDHLTTEGRNPATEGLDGLSTLAMVTLINSEDALVAGAVGKVSKQIAQAVDVISDRLKQGGRLFYMGAGTSGRLGVLDASECPPTFNSDPKQVVGLIAGGDTALRTAVEGAEDSPELGAEDLKKRDISSKDVLVGIATSGRTPYVVGAIDYARGLGAYTIALSCNEHAEIIPRADLAITPIVGPEVLSGSTRLKAGTATKLVLNTLTTAAMVKLGKTYGNLMVDLQPTNSKLVSRSIRIVGLATGLDREESQALLDRCEGEVKIAIVVQLAGCEPAEARKRLQRHDGHVGQAISG